MAPAKKRVRADTQVGPYRSSSSLHPIQKNGRGQRPVPTGLSWCQASGRCRHRPLRKGGAAATTLASGAQRSVCAAVTRDGWRVRQRSPPKVSSNLGQSLSRLTATAPFAQGSLALWGGTLYPPGFQRLMDAALESVGADLRVGPWAGPAKRRVRADT